MDWVIGFVIAVVIAVTGVGAGVITAPLLVLFLHIPIEIAVSTALAYSAVVKLVVVPVQIFRRQVNFRVLGVMLIGGLPGVIIGSLGLSHVTANSLRPSLSFFLGAIIIFTSGWYIYSYFNRAGIARPLRDHSKLLSGVMFPIGAEVGFSSSGAGALGTLALLGLTNLSTTEVVGTDLAFGLVIAVVGTGVHGFGAHVASSLFQKMALGGVFGGIVGAGVTPRVPNRRLRLALSLWLIAIGFQLCHQALVSSHCTLSIFSLAREPGAEVKASAAPIVEK